MSLFIDQIGSLMQFDLVYVKQLLLLTLLHEIRMTVLRLISHFDGFTFQTGLFGLLVDGLDLGPLYLIGPNLLLFFAKLHPKLLKLPSGISFPHPVRQKASS